MALLALVDAEAATLELDDLGVVEEAVEEDTGGDVVAEHHAKVFDGPVAGENGGASFVTGVKISSRSSAAVGGNVRAPRSSRMRRSTRVRRPIRSLRVPVAAASERSSARSKAER